MHYRSITQLFHTEGGELIGLLLSRHNIDCYNLFTCFVIFNQQILVDKLLKVGNHYH